MVFEASRRSFGLGWRGIFAIVTATSLVVSLFVYFPWTSHRHSFETLRSSSGGRRRLTGAEAVVHERVLDIVRRAEAQAYHTIGNMTRLAESNEPYQQGQAVNAWRDGRPEETPDRSHNGADLNERYHPKRISEKAEQNSNDAAVPNDANVALQCRPRHNVVFWKTHKCGSSTVQNIMFRHVEKNELRMLLPTRNHLFNLVQRFNASRDIPKEFLQRERPFNVFAHHARFSAADVATVMPRDAVYVTILRSPLTLFESIYTYLGLAKSFGSDTNPLPIKSFLKEPHKYYSVSDVNVHRRYGRNPVLYDLGLDPEDMDDHAKIAQVIKEVDLRFHLVMFMEYFDESLILLRDLLCWDFDDVAYLKLNAREAPNPMTLYTRDMIRKWNSADMQLYKHFNVTFWKRVHSYGLARMERDIRTLQESNERLMKRCVQERTSADDIDNTQESIWHPEGVDIVAYRLTDSAMNDRTCKNLIKPEKLFTDEIRARQGDYYFPPAKQHTGIKWMLQTNHKAKDHTAFDAMLDRIKKIDKAPAR